MNQIRELQFILEMKKTLLQVYLKKKVLYFFYVLHIPKIRKNPVFDYHVLYLHCIVIVT